MFCLHCIHLTYTSGEPALSVVFSTITEGSAYCYHRRQK